MEFQGQILIVDLGEQRKFRCECLSCGYIFESSKHCRDIKCPKCGGEMRRLERPGAGWPSQKGSSEKWIVEGYCMTDDLDLQNDIISDEALRTLNNLKGLPVYYNHDPNQRIGTVLKSRFDKGREWVKIEISKLCPEIWKKIQEGDLNRFSIKGEATKVEQSFLPETKQLIKIIKSLRIEEVSLVSSPANLKAEVLRHYVEETSEKNMTKEELEKQEVEETEASEEFPEETSEIEENEETEVEEIKEPEEIEEEEEEISEEEEEEALKMALESDDPVLAKTLIGEVLKARRKKKKLEEVFKSAYTKCMSEQLKAGKSFKEAAKYCSAKVQKSAYTECMRQQLKAGKSFKEAAKYCKEKAKKYPYPYPYPTKKSEDVSDEEIQWALEVLEKARKKRKYPYPYAYPFPGYPYPYPKRVRRKSEIYEMEEVELGKKKKKPKYPYPYPYRYPGLKKKLPELLTFLEKLLNRARSEKTKKNLRVLKALVTHAAGASFVEPEKVLGLSDDPYTGIYEFREDEKAINLSGTKLKKEILRVGRWFHSDAMGGVLNVTKDALKKIYENFKKGVIEHVYVPLGHTSDPMRNAGEVTDLTLTEDGNSLIAEIEIRDDEVAKRIKEGLIKCTSASIDENYQNKETGEFVGPTLLHVALVSEPYIKGLSNFVELSEETGKYIIPVEFEDKFEQISLEEPEEAPESPEGEEEAESGTKKEEAAEEEKEVDLSEAEKIFDKFLKEGKVVPAQKELILKILTSKGSIDLGDGEKVDTAKALIELLEQQSPIVPLSEVGVVEDKEKEERKEEKEEEITLSEEEREFFIEKMGYTEEEAKEIVKEEREREKREAGK